MRCRQRRGSPEYSPFPPPLDGGDRARSARGPPASPPAPHRVPAQRLPRRTRFFAGMRHLAQQQAENRRVAARHAGRRAGSPAMKKRGRRSPTSCARMRCRLRRARPDLANLRRAHRGDRIETRCGGRVKPNPGRVAVHRLNRAGTPQRSATCSAEVDAQALRRRIRATRRVSTNVASVLSVSPLLLENYLSAARTISRLAVGDPTLNRSSRRSRSRSPWSRTSE